MYFSFRTCRCVCFELPCCVGRLCRNVQPIWKFQKKLFIKLLCLMFVYNFYLGLLNQANGMKPKMCLVWILWNWIWIDNFRYRYSWLDRFDRWSRCQSCPKRRSLPNLWIDQSRYWVRWRMNQIFDRRVDTCCFSLSHIRQKYRNDSEPIHGQRLSLFN